MTRVGSPNRTLWRLAVRGARAEPLRHLLIVGLIAVAVGASIAASVAVRTLEPQPEAQASQVLGRAALLVTVERPEVSYGQLPAELQAEVDRVHGGPLPSVSGAELDAAVADLAPPGTRVLALRRAVVDEVQVIATDTSDPVLTGRYRGDLGTRLAADEALVSAGLLGETGAGVGDVVALPGVGERRIVGEIEDADGSSALVAVASGTELPGPVAEERYLTGIGPDDDVLAVALQRRLQPADATADDAPVEARVTIVPRYFHTDVGLGPMNQPAVVGGLVALVLLALVGFVASAAFATGTRRRVREFGVLAAAAGAAPEHLAGLVRREAMVLGGAGVALGLVAGGAFTVALRPGLAWLAEDPSTPVSIGLADVLVPVVLGLIAALVAAWSPARTVARVPLVAALAGRVPLRRVARSVTPVSLALTAVGVAVLVGTSVVAGGAGGQTSFRPIVQALGVALVLLGVAGLAAPLLQRIGALAGRLPLRPRLAVRDSARQRTRSAATVAAAMAVLSVPVLVLVTAASGVAAFPESGSTARGDVAVVTGPVYGERRLSPTEDTVAAARRALPPIAEGFTVERATSTWSQLFVVVPTRAEAWVTEVVIDEEVLLASEDLLALLGVPDAPSDAVVIASPWLHIPADLSSGSFQTERGAFDEVPIVVAPRAVQGTMIVVGPDLWERAGLDATARTTLLRTEGPMTRAQIAAVERVGGTGLGEVAVLRVDATTGSGSLLDALLLTATFVGAVLLALVVVAMTTALSATESDRDLRTMAAVGADPRDRPRFRAWQSAYQVLLGGLLAVPAGVLLAASFRSIGPPMEPLVVPWLLIGALLVVVPIAVALPFRLFSWPGTALLEGRRPT